MTAYDSSSKRLSRRQQIDLPESQSSSNPESYGLFRGRFSRLLLQTVCHTEWLLSLETGSGEVA